MKSIWSTLGVAAIAFSTASAWAEPAIGVYTATIGGTAAAGSGGIRGKGKANSGSTALGAGSSFTFDIDSWSPSSEKTDLQNTTDAASFSSKLSSYSHGTIKIGSVSYPINMATLSSQSSAAYVITLLSSKTIQEAAQSNEALKGTGVAASVITVFVDTNGAGKTNGNAGSIFGKVGVTFTAAGIPQAHAGGASGTIIKTVAYTSP